MRQTKLEEAQALRRERIAAVRQGNAIWPALICFTGVTFVVYLLVKLTSGAALLDAGYAAQLGIAGALAAFGGWLLVRARYFYVAVDTRNGTRRLSGLTKAEQREIARRLSPES